MKKIFIIFINTFLIFILLYLSERLIINVYVNRIFNSIIVQINNDIKIYEKCKKSNNVLLCGRKKVKYKQLLVINRPHLSYFNSTHLKVCSKYNYIECSNSFILIGILTRPECIYERIITRRILKRLPNIIYVFISSLSISQHVNNVVEKEIKYFHDIIVFNILSSYYNCSIIMSCFYLYLYNNCKNIRWVLKLDIDTYFHYKLLYELLTNVEKNISVIGSINKNARLKCNKGGKWSITCENVSQKYLYLPQYPYGPGFVFNFSYLKCFFKFYQQNKYIIWIEDIFFGVLMKYCGMKYKDISKDTAISYSPKKNLNITKNKIFVHGLNPIEILLAN